MLAQCGDNGNSSELWFPATICGIQKGDRAKIIYDVIYADGDIEYNKPVTRLELIDGMSSQIICAKGDAKTVDLLTSWTTFLVAHTTSSMSYIFFMVISAYWNMNNSFRDAIYVCLLLFYVLCASYALYTCRTGIYAIVVDLLGNNDDHSLEVYRP